MHLHDLVEKEKIIKNINSFIGKIKQLPPVKSAVKRQIREREIYEFEILEIKEKDILFKASVEAGTYIRKLCHDFGEKLGVGAHMTHLRRTRVAHFYEKDSINLLTLKDLFYLYQNENNHEIRKHILPGEDIINNFKKVYVIDQAIKHVKNGLCVVIPAISKLHQDIKKNDTVAIMTLNEELLAMGEAMMDFEEIVSLKKGKAIKAKTVI
jgi:H/ACA ribonucleoprotein complex subunit 4